MLKLPAPPADPFRAQPAFVTLDLLAAAAAADPEAPAFSCLADATLTQPAVVLSHRQLHARVLQAANLFSRLGVSRRDAVGILLPLVPEACTAFWGAQTAGIALPMNYLLSVDHLAHLLDSVGCRVLVALGPDREFLIWEKALALKGRVPSLRHVVQVGGAAQEPGVVEFNEACDAEPSNHLLCELPRAEDTAAYFHTGGTTGAPKLACHSHLNEVHVALATAYVYGYRSRDRLFCGMPLFHVAGSLLMALAGLAKGGEIVLLTASGLRNKAVVRNFWALVAHYRPAILAGSPTSLVALLATDVDPALSPAAPTSVRLWFAGGAPVPSGIADAFEARFGVPVREGYGMTESAGLIAVTPVWKARVAGAAGPALPGVEIRIVDAEADPEAAREALPGQPGLILARGPNVFPGYVDSSMNAGSLTADRWLVTGDLGQFDADGFLRLTGRAKDVIIRGSHNIDPTAIEEIAAMHPGVLFCAAIGQPDPYSGEVPVLYASVKHGHVLDAQELCSFVAARVAEPPARPRQVYLVEAVPLTAVGKVFKPELRLDAAKRAFDAALVSLREEGAEFTVRAEQASNKGLIARVILSDAASCELLRPRVAKLMSGFTASLEVCT